MGRRRRKANRRFLILALTLVLLTAAATLAVSLFVAAFSSHNPSDYQPMDQDREEYLERKDPAPGQ